MKFVQCLHMPKLSSSSKLHLNEIINVSPASIFFMSRLAHCKVSAIYTLPIALKFFGQSSISKSLPHANIQLHLPSKSSSANLQSFYPERSFVKKVLARLIQMIWDFSKSSIWLNHHSPQNLSSIQQSMWDHHPIFYSGHILSLWGNYILYCFIIAKNLPGHDPTYITSLHQIWAHFI